MSQVQNAAITVGHYVVQEEIGRGSMSILYRALDTRAERPVALKLLPKDILIDDALRNSFEDLAQRLQSLHHSNIVPVYDFGEYQGQPYIVSRLMRGLNLREQIRLGPMSILESARIIEAIAPAIQRAHEQDILHRNLHPGNILYDDEGNAGVSDFSMAPFGRPFAQLSGVPVFGSPAYVAPEIGRRNGISPLNDVYSLGILFYHMLAGVPPYQGDVPAEVLRAHIEQSIPNLRVTRPDLPESVQQVILGALGKDPYDRYGSINELEQSILMIVERELGVSEQELYAAAYPAPPTTRPPSEFGEFDTVPEWYRKTGEDFSTTPAFEDFDYLATMPEGSESAAGVRVAAAEMAGKAAAVPAKEERSGERKRLQARQARRALGAWRAAEARRAGKGEFAVMLAGFTLPPVVQWSLVGIMVSILAIWLQVAGVFTYLYNTIYDITPTPIAVLPTATIDTVSLYNILPTASPDLLTLEGHSDEIDVIAYDPQGGRFASGAKDNNIVIWNDLTGAPIIEFDQHQGKINDLAFNSAGSLLASASEDNTVIIWDLELGIPLHTLTGHVSTDTFQGVDSVAWSTDGTLLATGGRDGRILVFDVSNINARPRQISELNASAGQVTAMAFNGDASRLYASTGADVVIWNADAGTPIRSVEVDGTLVVSLKLSPDGTVLMAGTANTLAFISASTGADLAQMRDQVFVDTAWSPDGDAFIMADLNQANVYSYPGLALLRNYDQPAMGITSVAWSPGTNRLVTGSTEGFMVIWGYDIGSYVGVAGPQDGPAILTEAITSDNLGSLAQWKWLGGHIDATRSMSFNDNSSRLVSGGQGGAVYVWDTKLGISALPLNSEFVRWIMGVGYQPGGNLIAVATQGEESITLYEAGNFQPLAQTLDGHEGGTNALAWSPDGGELSVATESGAIRVWTFADDGSTQSRDLGGHEGPVNYLAYSPDGSRLITASVDMAANQTELIFWDMGSGRQLGDAVIIESLVKQVAWSPGVNVAVAAENGMSIINASTSVVEKTYNDSLFFRSVQWSADGSLLAAGNDDGELILFDGEGFPLATLGLDETHGGLAYIAFSPDKNILATNYDDGLIVLWGVIE